jgi:DNA-binding IclR family transcriptional regulator
VTQIDVLQAFDGSATSLSAADVVERTGLPRSTVFRSLRALVESDFLFQEYASRRYTLGPRILQLGMAARLQLSSEDVVAGPILALQQQTKETVTFSVLDVPWRLCTYVLEAPSDLRHVAQVGARYPLHLGAAGKVMLAYLKPEIVDLVTATAKLDDAARTSLMHQLDAVRTSGYASIEGERVPGAAAVAAPVFVGERVFGSVAVTGPADRIRQTLHAHRPAVIETAQIISSRLSAHSSKKAKGNSKRRRGADGGDG